MFLHFKNLATVLIASASIAAHATTIDFEASGTPGNYNALDYPIDGFVFNYTMDNVDISGPTWGSYGPAHSGSFAALNNYGGPGEMTRADSGTFSVQNLWLKSWDGNTTTTVTGFLGGVQVGSASLNLSTKSWQEVSLNLPKVDSIQINAPGGIFLVDDITVNAVPEPEEYVLLLAGLAALGIVSRRQMRR